MWHRQPKELISKIIGAVCVLPFYFLLFTSHIFLKILYSRHDSVIAISRSSHMVGPLKNFSNRISRTNARMHANEDIWEIGQIMVGKGTRVAKEVKEAMKRIVVTSVGPATTAGMVVAMMGSQAMTTGRAATTGLVSDYDRAGGYDGAGDHEDEDIMAGKESDHEDGLEYMDE
jgi:hypothetical protein